MWVFPHYDAPSLTSPAKATSILSITLLYRQSLPHQPPPDMFCIFLSDCEESDCYTQHLLQTVHLNYWQADKVISGAFVELPEVCQHSVKTKQSLIQLFPYTYFKLTDLKITVYNRAVPSLILLGLLNR